MTIISVSLHPPKKAILRKEVKSLFLCKMHTPKLHIPNVFILVSLQQEFDAVSLSLLDDFFVKIKCSLK